MEKSHSITRPPSQRQMEARSPKSRVLAALMCFFFGVFGVHRFYVGKFWTGLLLLATGGGFGVWWIIDLVLILLGRFKDGEDRVLGPPRVDDHDHRRVEAAPGSHSRRNRLDRAGSDNFDEAALDRAEDEEDEVAFENDELLEDPLEKEFEELEKEMQDRSS